MIVTEKTELVTVETFKGIKEPEKPVKEPEVAKLAVSTMSDESENNKIASKRHIKETLDSVAVTDKPKLEGK